MTEFKLELDTKDPQMPYKLFYFVGNHWIPITKALIFDDAEIVRKLRGVLERGQNG